MKLLNVVLLCCLVAGSQANFLDDLTNALNGVLAAGKVVGSSLLDQLKQTGVTLASTAVGSLVNQLDQVAASGGSKRDLSALAPFVQKLEKEMADHSASQKLLFGLALKELEHVAENMTSLDSTSLEEILHMIDDIVVGHKKASDVLMEQLGAGVLSMLPHKRSLTDTLTQVGQDLAAIFSPQVESLQSVVGSVGGALKETATGLFNSLTETAQTLMAGQGAGDLQTALSSIFQQTLTRIQPHISNIVQHA
ncbi:uncharacterized protein LOC143275222 [Babylonia areolata]|uniref:uncharacterized protein LOC143275222 n=1 Tax=Babylonia areolata TaxID=304850 RepID=UPI003FCF0F84